MHEAFKWKLNISISLQILQTFLCNCCQGETLILSDVGNMTADILDSITCKHDIRFLLQAKYHDWLLSDV